MSKTPVKRFTRKQVSSLAILYILCFVPAAAKLYEQQCFACANSDAIPWYENWHTLVLAGFVGCYILWKLQYNYKYESRKPKPDTNPLKDIK